MHIFASILAVSLSVITVFARSYIDGDAVVFTDDDDGKNNNGVVNYSEPPHFDDNDDKNDNGVVNYLELPHFDDYKQGEICPAQTFKIYCNICYCMGDQISAGCGRMSCPEQSTQRVAPDQNQVKPIENPAFQHYPPRRVAPDQNQGEPIENRAFQNYPPRRVAPDQDQGEPIESRAFQDYPLLQNAAAQNSWNQNAPESSFGPISYLKNRIAEFIP